MLSTCSKSSCWDKISLSWEWVVSEHLFALLFLNWSTVSCRNTTSLSLERKVCKYFSYCIPYFSKFSCRDTFSLSLERTVSKQFLCSLLSWSKFCCSYTISLSLDWIISVVLASFDGIFWKRHKIRTKFMSQNRYQIKC